MGGDQLYLHIRVVLGIILGLGITTLLKGVASIVVHPGRYRWSWIHLGWAAWTLITVVTFWWWEFHLGSVTRWTFESYLFVIAYCSSFYLLAALLFPDDISEYGDYGDYLLARRRWFFGLIAVMTLMDQIDTALKGASRWRELGIAYPLHTAVMLVIAGLGMVLSGRRAQLGLVVTALIYQSAYFAFEYFTLVPG
jgi:hypothetical protein